MANRDKEKDRQHKKAYRERALGKVCMRRDIFRILDNHGFIQWDRGSTPYFMDKDGQAHFIIAFGD